MKKTKYGMARVYEEDLAALQIEIKKENALHVKDGFRATVATAFHDAVRGYVECRECGLLLNKCNCNNISK
jgi:hypothetical protein